MRRTVLLLLVLILLVSPVSALADNSISVYYAGDPDSSVRQVELAYKLDINEYRGNRSVQLIIDHLWPLA